MFGGIRNEYYSENRLFSMYFCLKTNFQTIFSRPRLFYKVSVLKVNRVCNNIDKNIFIYTAKNSKKLQKMPINCVISGWTSKQRKNLKGNKENKKPTTKSSKTVAFHRWAVSQVAIYVKHRFHIIIYHTNTQLYNIHFILFFFFLPIQCFLYFT